MQERSSHILEQWFISEPPLFQVLCIHELVANSQMNCPLRSGRKRLEYNPEIMREMSDIADSNPRMVSRHTFPDADHGISYLVDTARYRSEVECFLNKVL